MLHAYLQNPLYQRCVPSQNISNQAVSLRAPQLSDYTSERTNLQSQLLRSDTAHILYCSISVKTVSKLCLFTYCLERQGSPRSAVTNPSVPACVYCTVFNALHAAGLHAPQSHEGTLGYFKFKTPPSWAVIGI